MEASPTESIKCPNIVKRKRVICPIRVKLCRESIKSPDSVNIKKLYALSESSPVASQ